MGLALKPKRMTGLRFSFLIGGMLALSAASSLHAQSVQHSSWRGYYPSIHDTVILSFGEDSALVMTPTHVPVLQSGFKLKGDLISFHDSGGMNACKDLGGSYHVRVEADTLTLVMAEDPCDVRAGLLIIKPWVRVR